MWIAPDLFAAAPEFEVRTRCRPSVYADALVQRLLELKQVFHLPLGALQGFAQSLRKLAFPSLPVPNYTTLSRRAQTLKVAPPAQRPKEPLHLVLDSTGLKVYGEGEWKLRKHGWSKRRTWRKVHRAMDANTGQICAALMTHQDEGDGEVLPDLLDQIPADVAIDTIGGDGACDTKACLARIATRGAAPSVPPHEGATPWPESTPGAAWRNAAIDSLAQSSSREWKQATGYHRRSLAEALMYGKSVLSCRVLLVCMTKRAPGDRARMTDHSDDQQPGSVRHQDVAVVAQGGWTRSLEHTYVRIRARLMRIVPAPLTFPVRIGIASAACWRPIVRTVLCTEALVTGPCLNQRAVHGEMLPGKQATLVGQTHDFSEKRFHDFMLQQPVAVSSRTPSGPTRRSIASPTNQRNSRL
ncbi:hypothetical protein QF000_007950 [Paraburkholderia atlantica]